MIGENSETAPSKNIAWLVGVGLALLLVGLGVFCIYTEQRWEPDLRRLTPSNRSMLGREAVALGWVFITAGLFVHFHWFPSYRTWMRRPAATAKILAAVTFIASLGWFLMAHNRIG